MYSLYYYIRIKYESKKLKIKKQYQIRVSNYIKIIFYIFLRNIILPPVHFINRVQYNYFNNPKIMRLKTFRGD